MVCAAVGSRSVDATNDVFLSFTFVFATGVFCYSIILIAILRGATMFITFEGIEGCGKTTQVGLVKNYLISACIPALFLREPGGTALGEKLRPILLTGDAINPLSELFLYEACRAEIVNGVIQPALTISRSEEHTSELQSQR